MILESDSRLELLDEPAQPGTAIAARPQQAMVATGPDDLIRLAVSRGASVDELDRLITLRERMLAIEAKQKFDEAFAAFKAEGVRLMKNKTVASGPLRGSRFAELWTIIDVVTPALSRHELSTSWKLTKDDKDWLEVTCFLKHAAGHVETASMGGPPDKREGDAKSPIQARASSNSYLERQTLKAVLGLSEAGDDAADGASPPAEDDKALDAWREKALEGSKALEAHYNANVPTEDFWKKHGPALRKAAKDADADEKAKAGAKAKA